MVLAVLLVCAAARSDAVAAHGAAGADALLAGYRPAFRIAAALLLAGAAVAPALLPPGD